MEVQINVLGKGKELLSIHNSRRSDLVGFDHEINIKQNLPIVSDISEFDLPNRQSVFFCHA
jgi:hypothetical protein